MSQPEGDSDESDGDQHARPAKRGQGGKKDDRWILKQEMSGSDGELNTRVQEFLQELQDELGVSAHLYKRLKVQSPDKPQLTDFWHVKNQRKYGATLSCPFQSTTSCEFKIKYVIKNSQLRIWTLAEHDHSDEQRQRGLSIDKASKVFETVQQVPTSK